MTTQPGMTPPSDIDTTVQRVQMRSIDDGDRVLATIDEVEDNVERSGTVTIWLDLPNGSMEKKKYNVPANWNEKHDFVRFVEWESAPWESSSFKKHEVEGSDIEVERRDGSWVPAIPERTESHRESMQNVWGMLDAEEKMVFIFGVLTLVVAIAMTATFFTTLL